MVTSEPQIADRIERVRVELDIPLTTLSERTGIPRTTLQRLIKDGDKFTVKQLKVISRELGRPFLSWFEDAA